MEVAAQVVMIMMMMPSQQDWTTLMSDNITFQSKIGHLAWCRKIDSFDRLTSFKGQLVCHIDLSRYVCVQEAAFPSILCFRSSLFWGCFTPSFEQRLAHLCSGRHDHTAQAPWEYCETMRIGPLPPAKQHLIFLCACCDDWSSSPYTRF